MANADAFLAARDMLLAHRTDAQAARAAFRWPQLDRFNFALDHFDRMAAGNDQPALRFIGPGDYDSTVSFAALAARSNQVANHLRTLGVGRGDRVLLLLGNVPALWEAMLGCCKLGAVVVPATTMLTEDDLRDRFDRGHVRHAIVAGEHAARFAPLGAGFTRIAVGGADGWHRFEASYTAPTAFEPDGETRATDPLLLYFTSGTTAKPKLVLHSHQSYPVGHLSTMYWIGLQPGDVHLNISSPGWAKHAWSSFFAPWIAGATIVILNQPRFDARHLLAVLDRARITTFCAPPTVWRMLIQEDLDGQPRPPARSPGRRRTAQPGGHPPDPARLGPHHPRRLRPDRNHAADRQHAGHVAQPGSMGWPLPGYDIALLDPDGAPAEEGEIAISLDPRPLALMDGYQAEDGTLRGVEGRWYRTGDTAARNPDGSLTYIGRSDDVFKSSGYRISPFELESVLIEHPAVAEAAIIPSPDPTRTALPKAFVLLAAGHEPDAATAASIFAHLRARLAPYKRVRRLEFADLPKTISGKIRRVELRRLETARRQQGARGDLEFLEEDLA